MKTIEIFKETFEEIRTNLKYFVPIFLLLIGINNLELIFKLLGTKEESLFAIFISFLSFGLALIVYAKVILYLQNKDELKKISFKYFLPSYFLYSLYISILFLMGSLLLIIPGLYVLVFFSLVPLIAGLEDSQLSYYKRSKQIVSKNLKLFSFLSVFILLLELVEIAIKMYGQNQQFIIQFQIIFSMVSSIFSMIFGIATFKAYKKYA